MERISWILFAQMLVACGGQVTTPTDAEVPDGHTLDGRVVCARAADCDDGQYCNGLERCEPGAAGAGADGCVQGTPPCGDPGETCDEASRACASDDCTEPDRDNDGNWRIGCGDGDDCDDDDPTRYPGNPEVCDALGHDEDCDPETITGSPDMDGDGHIDDACWNVRGDGTENRGTDCDDARNTVHPEVIEACNGVDDDCDGMIDEEVLVTFYRDLDGDNYGRTLETVMACGRPPGYALVGGDCDDGETGNAHSPTVNPAAVEACNGRDDDCDGLLDPGCDCTVGSTRPCGLAIGECMMGTQICVGGTWGGCDGRGPTTEVCNGLDDDCDGMMDEGVLVRMFLDADGDAWGDPGLAMNVCPGAVGYAGMAGDCDDDDPSINPAAIEICGGVDENCNGSVDETGAVGEVTFYRDADGDGHGSASSGVTMACSAPAGYSALDDDCFDGDPVVFQSAPLVHPGAVSQPQPYCTFGSLCVRPPGMTIRCCNGSGEFPSSWDYNCSGTVEPDRPPTCVSRPTSGCYASEGPQYSQPASSCGVEVQYRYCDIVGCVLRSGAIRPLECR